MKKCISCLVEIDYFFTFLKYLILTLNFSPKVEIFENEITIYLLNLRDEDPNEYEERRLIGSSAENTALIKVSTGEFTTYPPISAGAEYVIFFVAHSGNPRFLFQTYIIYPMYRYS